MNKKLIIGAFLFSQITIADTFYDFISKDRVSKFDSNFFFFSNKRMPGWTFIPRIGIYGTPYRFIHFGLVYIELMPAMLPQILPHGLMQQLQQKTGQSLDGILKNKDVKARMVILEGLDQAPQTYNLVLHEFLLHITKQQYPNYNLLMGIFDPNGVQPGAKLPSIAFNALREENVNVHNGGGLAYSPPNAHFSIPANREISTFWAAALSPKKDSILVTFYVLANTAYAKRMLKDLVNTELNGTYLVQNICDLIPALEKTSEKFARPEDKNALKQAASLLKKATSTGVDANYAQLSFDFCALKYNLKLLEYQLDKLVS